MLERLVQEYDFVLAKVDIDAEPELAQAYEVQGVPDVRVVVDGQVTEGFVGVLPEPQLREFLAQLNLRSQLDETLQAIYDKASQGDHLAATEQLSNLLHQHPTHVGLKLEAANFYIETEQFAIAEKLLAELEYEKSYVAQVKFLKGILFFKQVQLTSTEHPLEASFQRAVEQILAENYQLALDNLLDLVKRDRQYRQDGARKAMLAVFDLLGDEHPLTRDYRKRLMTVLY
jgi:putative thioredoxin